MHHARLNVIKKMIKKKIPFDRQVRSGDREDMRAAASRHPRPVPGEAGLRRPARLLLRVPVPGDALLQWQTGRLQCTDTRDALLLR